jgi:hypothetical protein
MVIRESYQSKEEEKIVFDWIDKVVEFLPEFESDMFKSLMHNMNCTESDNIIKCIGYTMLRLNILELRSESFIQFSEFGRLVKKHGNYSKYLNWVESQKILEENRQQTELENLKYSIQMNKWLLRTKWLPHLLSLLALIIALIALFA